jgi:hypothetical protein
MAVELDWMCSLETVDKYDFIFDLSFALSAASSLMLTWKPRTLKLARTKFTNLRSL